MVVFICTQPEVSEILWLFLKNVKFPWPTELTISHIKPDDGLNPPIKVIPHFQQVMWSIHELIVRELNVQKTLMVFKSQHCLVIQVHEQYIPLQHDSISVKFTKKFEMLENSKSRGKRINTVCTLTISLNSLKDLTVPWFKVKFPDFSSTLKKFFPDHFLIWQPRFQCGN